MSVPISIRPLVFITLVIGANAHTREVAIWASIELDKKTNVMLQSGHCTPSKIALILEGMSDGKSPHYPEGGDEDDNFYIKRIAPGCLCCIGSLTLRVTLNCLLREHPQHIYISIADTTHLSNIRQLLLQAPYDALLILNA
ncbi:MAG: hypothetical protein NWQ13_09925, partial [Glaciimonas sp.]|nr:hypothetical protein [Glaciimonas sp.]